MEPLPQPLTPVTCQLPLSPQQEQCKEIFDKINAFIKAGDKDKIKKMIDSFHPPNASYDDTKVKEQRTGMFKYGLIYDAFHIVEMLYDYWSGDLHWIGHDINRLKTLGQLLQDARVVCDVREQQLKIDIHSLITFNAFQQTLYSKISRLRNTTPKEAASMLVEVLCLYDTYSDLEKVRIPEEVEENELKLKADLTDETSEYIKGREYINYVVYFRKLDLNVALLVLENLFVIRQDLKKKKSNQVGNSAEDEADKYKEIECALYHFIYCTAEGWRLYLPRRRLNNIMDVEVEHDEDEWFNTPVLFLERKYFNKKLKALKLILEKHINNSKSDQDSEQEDKLLDYNYLTPTYMSDYYSLSKIVFYIGALENTQDSDVLMIERVLQVTGEMIKSSPNTEHVLDSTKALLQIGITVETVRHLQYIRNYLSHVYERHLITRIQIANTQSQIFDDIKKDLIQIKKVINSIRDIYKPILEKSGLETGLRLLDERIESLPVEAKRHVKCIHEKCIKTDDFFIKELKAYTGLKAQPLLEIIYLVNNKIDIESKIKEVETTIPKKIASHTIQNIKQSLEFQKNIRCAINSQLRQYKIKDLPDNPNTQDINITQRAVDRIKKRNKDFNADFAKQALEKMTDFPRFFEAIKIVLSFCLNDSKLFTPKCDLLKDLPKVEQILKVLEVKYNLSNSCNQNLKNHSHRGIKTLSDILKRKEKGDDNTKLREELLECLISRIKLLKDNLEYKLQIPLKHIALSEQLLQSYKNDLKFRFVLEMILADIANILENFGIKKLMIKSSKILSETDLGKVLDHGHPILEVIGDIFNSYDLSAALLSKAIMFAEDGPSIEALFNIFKYKLDNVTKKYLYKTFEMCPRWEFYVKLVP